MTRKRFTGVIRLPLAALLLYAVDASAAPQEGFGLGLAASAHDVHMTSQNFSQRYHSAGMGLVGDAQFVFSDSFSLNPALQLTVEKASGDLTNTLVNSQAVLQFRCWRENTFIAPLLAYSVEDALSGSVIKRAEYGPGIGLAAGWESPDGVTLQAQADLPESLYFSSSQRRAGAWLSIGYRWH